MSLVCGSLFEEGGVAPASLALRKARGDLANDDVAPLEKRTALVARLAIPRARDLAKGAGTCDSSGAPARPIFDLRHSGLTSLEGEDGPRWGDVLVRAHLFARLSAAQRENFFSS